MFINPLVTRVIYIYDYMYQRTLLSYFIQHGNEFEDYEHAQKLDYQLINKSTSSIT